MNIFANFDILYYLSNKHNRFPEQTLNEMSTMLYLAELLSIYEGVPAANWGYGFSNNEYGAPISVELINEVNFLSSIGIIETCQDGYYRVSKKRDDIPILSQAVLFNWKLRYIDTAIDSLLAKPFPKVISALKTEPCISILLRRKKSTSLLSKTMTDLLYSDFQELKNILNDESIDLIVPASVWIDYLIQQQGKEETND